MNNNYAIPTHLFNDHTGANENSMTLATYIHRIMNKIESDYGSRDRNWWLAGIEFHEGVPQVWYPESDENSVTGSIVIMLGAETFRDFKCAVYQLAHECVHTLSTVIGVKAPVLEEGLATAFSEDFIEQWFGETDKKAYTQDVRYRDAAANVRKLLQLEPDAIKRLREKEPAFKRMTAATFSDAGLDKIPQPLINELLRTF
ncbi:hypothetical protein [Cronobacter sakazakii]|uniref:hypothetical protein n=1 Tax=Cronobacter sakazakii TaxID=28141 RepID=UPI000DA12118|nr:hypothetical protein [Cronobacter sakazakii]